MTACAFPRRTIALNEVADTRDLVLDPPADVWQFTILNAQIPPTQRSGLAWDNDGSGPDCVVRIYRGDTLVYESPRVDDSLTPEWNITLPRNLWTPSTQLMRYEVWDIDGVSADIVGIIRYNGLPPNALPDAIATLRLEGTATLQVRANLPRPYRGVGVREVEQRSDSLVVVSIVDQSPAGRAGIVVGERITKVGEYLVGDVGPERATTYLSLAAGRGQDLVVVNARGESRTVSLDRGFTWFTM